MHERTMQYIFYQYVDFFFSNKKMKGQIFNLVCGSLKECLTYTKALYKDINLRSSNALKEHIMNTEHDSTKKNRRLYFMKI
uniref:Uncharacterized protein n=1 Tax=Strongyloides venezuelensis TaxID=75913 RepID=A0A0K0G5F4_STRVS